MSAQSLLPSGGVRLPTNVGGSLPIPPKYKAIILYFMFFAQRAEVVAETTGEMDALHYYAHIIARSFLKKVYNVDIHPDSIMAYYRGATANAEMAVKWDQYAVAEIISNQVQDEEIFEEVTSFLKTVERVSSSSHIALCVH